MRKVRNRNHEKCGIEYMQTFGAVCIEGPKYCGKTWTARSRAKSAAFVGNPENNFQTRTMAQISPDLVLKGDLPRLIDEWQEVPSLWDAVRFEVDKDSRKGKYILTDSATPNHKGIMHSGTARISKVRMNTMSLYETGDSTGEVTLERLIYYAVRGGWPGNLETPEKTCGKLAKEYLKTIVDDDMFSVDGVKRDSRKVWSLLHSLGRNESTLAGNSTLRKDMGAKDEIEIDRDTISDYLDIFQRLFILDDQPAYNTNLRSSRRILKSAKRHFTDPSLAVAALGATPKMLLNDLNTFGLFFETMCIRDLRVYADALDGSVYHYRDKNGLECDAVVHLRNGAYGLIEIKLGGEKLIEDGAKTLTALTNIIDTSRMKAPAFCMVLTGVGDFAYRRTDGVYVVPIGCLKD